MPIAKFIKPRLDQTFRIDLPEYIPTFSEAVHAYNKSGRVLRKNVYLFWERNCQELLTMIQSVPPRHVHLSNFWHGTNLTPTCGSVACIGGWSAIWPYFQVLGVSRDDTGVPLMLSGGPAGKTLNSINLGFYLTGEVGMFNSGSGWMIDPKKESIDRIEKRLTEVRELLSQVA